MPDTLTSVPKWREIESADNWRNLRPEQQDTVRRKWLEDTYRAGKAKGIELTGEHIRSAAAKIGYAMPATGFSAVVDKVMTSPTDEALQTAQIKGAYRQPWMIPPKKEAPSAPITASPADAVIGMPSGEPKTEVPVDPTAALALTTGNTAEQAIREKAKGNLGYGVLETILKTTARSLAGTRTFGIASPEGRMAEEAGGMAAEHPYITPVADAVGMVMGLGDFGTGRLPTQGQGVVMKGSKEVVGAGKVLPNAIVPTGTSPAGGLLKLLPGRFVKETIGDYIPSKIGKQIQNKTLKALVESGFVAAIDLPVFGTGMRTFHGQPTTVENLLEDERAAIVWGLGIPALKMAPFGKVMAYYRSAKAEGKLPPPTPVEPVPQKTAYTGPPLEEPPKIEIPIVKEAPLNAQEVSRNQEVIAEAGNLGLQETRGNDLQRQPETQRTAAVPEAPGEVGTEKILYHGSKANVSANDIEEGHGILKRGIYMSESDKVAKIYGEKGSVHAYRLSPKAKTLDLSTGEQTLDYIVKNGILESKDIDVDLENYILSGRVFQADPFNRMGIIDDIMSTAKGHGFDVVRLLDDLGGKSDNVATVILNKDIITPANNPPPRSPAVQEGQGEVKPAAEVVAERQAPPVATPQVLYHATRTDKPFTEFKPTSHGSYGEHSYFYFSDKKNVLDRMIKAGATKDVSPVKRTITAEVDVKKPLDLTGDKAMSIPAWINELEGKGIKIPDDVLAKMDKAEYPDSKRTPWEIFRNDQGKLRQALLDAGYDGIKWDEWGGTTTVALSPKQVKIQGSKETRSTQASAIRKTLKEDGGNGGIVDTENKLHKIISDRKSAGKSTFYRVSRGMEDSVNPNFKSNLQKKSMTGQKEQGMSTATLWTNNEDILSSTAKADESLPLDHPINIAGALSNYGHMVLEGKKIWLLDGKFVGLGYDGEPILRNTKPITEVSPVLFADLWDKWAVSTGDKKLIDMVAKDTNKIRKANPAPITPRPLLAAVATPPEAGKKTGAPTNKPTAEQAKKLRDDLSTFAEAAKQNNENKKEPLSQVNFERWLAKQGFDREEIGGELQALNQGRGSDLYEQWKAETTAAVPEAPGEVKPAAEVVAERQAPPVAGMTEQSKGEGGRLGIVPPGFVEASKMADVIVDGVKKLMPPEEQARLPIKLDTSTPLPDFQDRATSTSIFSRPFGMERLPVLGKMFGGRFNAKDPVTRAIATYNGELGVGKAISGSFGQEINGRISHAFKTDTNGDLNVVPREKGASLKISDVFEKLRLDDTAYQLSPQQRKAWDDVIKPTLDRVEALKNQYDLLKDGGDGEETLASYFPRQVVEMPKEQATSGGGVRVGAKQGFQKERAFDTEAEGWNRGYKYETNPEARLVTLVDRIYKAIADKRLADDPALGGQTRAQLVDDLRMGYAEELVSGVMTEAKIQRIADGIAAKGRAFEPAFAGKIFDPKTAEILNNAFPQSGRSLRHIIAQANNVTKAITLGFDLGVAQLQGLPTLLSSVRHPGNFRIWAEAQARAVVAMASPESFGRYVRANEKYVREISQMGSGVGRLPEMMAGLNKGEIVERLPLGVGKTAAAFGRQFSAFLDVAKVELWKSWRKVTPESEWPEVIQSIESQLNMGRMESVGISRNRSLLERAVLLAPSYYRGGLNLVAAAMQKGVGGKVARDAVLGYIAGGSALFYGIGKSLGMDDKEIRRRFNPASPDFMMWTHRFPTGRVIQFGLGGFHRSLLKLAGSIVQTTIEHPGNWASLAPDKNPLSRWYRAHASPAVSMLTDAYTGRDYMGRQTNIGTAAESLLPLTLRPAVSKAEKVPPTVAEYAAQFSGLSVYGMTPGQQVKRLASEFNRKAGVTPTGIYGIGESKFSDLEWALRLGKKDKAKEEYAKLIKLLTATAGEGKKPQAQIADHFKPLSSYRFTGSAEREKKFVKTLTREQRKAYDLAKEENRKVLIRLRNIAPK